MKGPASISAVLKRGVRGPVYPCTGWAHCLSAKCCAKVCACFVWLPGLPCALCMETGRGRWSERIRLFRFHFCLASIVRSLSASLSLSHWTLSRRACARMSLCSCVSRSWSWVARACERCWMSSHVVWVIHGCLGAAVSAGTCVVHACWTVNGAGGLVSG